LADSAAAQIPIAGATSPLASKISISKRNYDYREWPISLFL
jgi:hypothetical protein